MQYKIYKFHFKTGVHFGNGSLSDSQYFFLADTLFSALCSEAVKYGEDKLQELFRYVKEDKLQISDAFPYIDDVLYLPKPAVRIQTGNDGNSKTKKKFKKLQYIPSEYITAYLNGEFPIEIMENFHEKLGAGIVKTSAAVRGLEETLPYRVGIYRFKENSGLYIIAGYETVDAGMLLGELLEAVSYRGIGGKRSSGLGRFELTMKNVPENMLKRLETKNHNSMTLSVSLPTEEELEEAIKEAQYKLVKRSGFVYSDNYAQEFLRKKDLYVFASGSCFSGQYKGDIYDVSEGGKHAVYRYAKPMFMGVDV